MISERKPLAPDRPGLYMRSDGVHLPIVSVFGNTAIANFGNEYIGGVLKRDYLLENCPDPVRIISFSPDDATYCLSQARLLCPEGYAVVPVEPTPEMLAATNAFKAAHVYKLMIASAAKGM